ncbi:hypothetical protein A6A06_32350 [Streptomyces sp. CB02923]|uniref:hypothetical protein n=1 Tax=Streptomyces sp. CB02923 TaxID=1718985 RepID=UPI000938F435|nr:hypothetical protein [Streptomyces sp. CB02923]OKH97270.1 hypothetical protein A6A06_32350 [Streptomyces sp. CB02923]
MSFGHGGPFGPGGPDSSTPDWDALADESEARGKRRRWLIIGGGALATAAVAGIVATAVITSNKDDTNLPQAQKLPDEPDAPKPSFSDVTVPPPPNPRDYITDPKKDTAALTPATLFPEKDMVLGKNSYPRMSTATTGDCTAGTHGPLGSVLQHNGCKQLLRATYSKDGVAVTVGVAVFGSKDAAFKVKAANKASLAPLAGGGVGSFCQGAPCTMYTNATGRYAYFTIAGNLDGSAVTKASAKALQIARDGGKYAYNRIWQRGTDQAAKAARAQS